MQCVNRMESSCLCYTLKTFTHVLWHGKSFRFSHGFSCICVFQAQKHTKIHQIKFGTENFSCRWWRTLFTVAVLEVIQLRLLLWYLNIVSFSFMKWKLFRHNSIASLGKQAMALKITLFAFIWSYSLVPFLY